MSDEYRYWQLLERKKAILEARRHLLPFVRLMRPDPNDVSDATRTRYVTKPVHELIANELEALVRGDITRLIINTAPRHGKTDLASRALPAWVLGKHPDWAFILGTYGSDFAKDLGRDVRDFIQSPAYQQVFPGTRLKVDTKAQDKQQTTHGGILYAVGRGSALTGRGANVLGIDDPIKDRVEADSQTIRDRLWTWFWQVAMSRLMDKTGRVVLTQTRWHEDDIVGRLTDPSNPHYNPNEARKWRVIDLPAMAEDNDPLGRRQGAALWPERFDEKFLSGIRNSDPRGFSALYQCRPSPDEGSFFQAEDLQVYTSPKQLPKQLRYYAASDHAVGLSQHSDKTAMGVVGMDTEGVLWVLPDLFWKRADANTVVNAIIWYIKRYKPLFWWAERGHITKSIGPFLRTRMLEQQAFATIDEITPSQDKQTRAQAIHGRISMGRVRFPAFADWWPEARRQLLTFPFGSYDDFVDMLSLFGLGLDKQRPASGGRIETREAPQVGTLAWVKWKAEQDAMTQTRNRHIRDW